MLFPTVEFAIFFPVVLVLSWLLMPRQALWKAFILLASYAFYAAANPRFCLLLGGVTIGNQAAARLMARTEAPRARKRLIVAAVAANLLTLGVFKYYSFFVEDVGGLLEKTGLDLPLPLVTIALPVGISFFIFQAISYIVDVYRRVVEPSPAVDVAVYLSFFPHLVAGPIVRAAEFLPQLKEKRDPKKVAVGSAVLLISLGLVKKLMIADYLARSIVDPVFGVPSAYAAPDILLASYAYTAQIYCDFSGYTDMAIGLALLMGYVFPQNFMSPYRATGFQDFWRRWHMTLSRFLRDFLYIPLGGNRGSKLFTSRNLMLTMILGGLWHGAAWTFILWGAFHGAMLVTERFIGGKFKTPAWFRWFVTFHLIVFGWILFRSQGLDQFATFMERMVTPGAATLISIPIVLAIVVPIGLQLVPAPRLADIQARLERLRPVTLGVAFALLVVLVSATLSSQGVAPFIYFQF
jgi:D-alanyl-lipoteichoic acid acyltransferase DltB (MBOAT superfamily)